MHTAIKPVMAFALGLIWCVISVSAASQQSRPEPAPDNRDEPPQQKTEASPPTQTPPDASAKDVLEAFQRDRPTRVPISPTGGPDERIPEFSAPAGGSAHHLPDGFFLVDRVGRAVRDGEWHTFVVEGQSEDHPEPPMKLLPNLLLERMVRESDSTAGSVLFVVSGEVTEFMGENYLLLRKLLRRRDLGNLHK